MHDLIHPPADESRRAERDDRRRLEMCVSLLSAGADRIRCLYRVPRAKTDSCTAGGAGSPATVLLESLRRLPDELDEEEQRHRGRRAARGDTAEVNLEWEI